MPRMKTRGVAFAIVFWACSLPVIPAHAAYEAHLVDTAIGGVAWHDVNHSGMLDPDEPGLSQVAVTVTDADGNDLATTTTGADGKWQVQGPQPGGDASVRVCFESPDGFTPTQQQVPGSTHQNASSINPETGCTDQFTVIPGQVDLNWHAGYLGPVAEQALGTLV
jgi:hypothetical protein